MLWTAKTSQADNASTPNGAYIFQGNAQVLDHILVSPALLLGGRPDFEPVHINTEFSNQASDHDPPIVRFELDG